MNNWKVLTVFYSHSGNTRACADQIHKTVGGDMVEIIPVEPYPQDYEAVVKQAKQELKSGYKPALRTRVENIESYDVIFVGSPNWWNTVAPPVMTFLSTHDLSGKATVPFITHAGSGLGKSVKDISGLCPDATVLEGLAVWGSEVKTAQTRVSEWLRKLGMLEQCEPSTKVQELNNAKTHTWKQ
jgi:flavodoxin